MEMFAGFSLYLYLVITGVVELLKTGKVSNKWFEETSLGQRLLPVLPIVLGIPFAIVMMYLSLDPVLTSLKVAIQHGITTGFYAMGIFKIAKTSVIGKGLKEMKEESKAE